MASFADRKAQRAARQGSYLNSADTIKTNGLDNGNAASIPGSTQTIAADTPSNAVDHEEAVYAADENRLLGLEDEGMHVRKRRRTGRGLFATKPYSPGQTIYRTRSTPPVTVLSTQHLASHCSKCFLTPAEAALLRQRKAEGLKRCGACKIVHYCSATCQTADWTAHKPECATMQKLREQYRKSHSTSDAASGVQHACGVQHESVRAIGRLFWEKKRAEGQGKEPVTWHQYLLLQTHLDPDKLDAVKQQVYRVAYYILACSTSAELSGEMALAMLMKEYDIPGNAELQMMKIISRYQVNAFTLDSPDLSALGASANPTLAMANHSCDPNAVVVFPQGSGMPQLTAIRPIEADEEILICYVDVAAPFAVRQAELRNRYNFTCECTLCATEGSFADPRWAVRSGNESGGYSPMPSFFKYDPQESLANLPSRAQDFQRAIECGKSLLEADERGVYDRPNDQLIPVISELRACIKALSQVCPPSTHPIMPLNRLAVRLLTVNPPTTTQQLAIVLQHMQSAIEGAEAIYTPHHPTLAILAAQKARLLAMEVGGGDELPRLRRAIEAYRMAIKRCEGCFGNGGGLVGMQLRAELGALEGEVSAMIHHT